MFFKRIKIFISLLFSLALSYLIINFSLILPKTKSVPNFLKTFTQLNLNNSNLPKTTSKPISFNGVPFSTPIPTHKIINTLFPTKKIIKKTPTPYKRPTLKPTIKILSSPTPTPTEQAIGIQRPGTNIDETLKTISKKTCVPSALFKAIGINESGGRLSKLSKNEFILFNRYNWWNEKTTSLTQVCYGIAYNHHTGLVPPNSQYANQRCMGAETFSTDIFSLGFLSISQSEEDAYKERVKGIMRVDNIDRRVIFDTLMIAGLHYKNISTYRGDECENWEAKYIAKTACKYHGKCYYNWAGRSGDYCQETCDYYNQLTTGEKADCNNVSSRYFVDNGNDGFCTFK